MKVPVWALVIVMLVAAACAAPAAQAPAGSPAVAADAGASVAPSATTSPTEAPTASPSATPAPPVPEPTAAPAVARSVADVVGRIDPTALDSHMRALASFGSRDPRHSGHARAVAYLRERLAAVPGIDVQTHRSAYQGIPLETVLGVIDPPGGAPAGGWVLVSAHYDSIGTSTPGWRPAIDAAPGANDNATGTAALLEYARVLAAERESLRQRVVLAFFDGEELFFKGSGAYLASLPRPYPYKAAINIDMVGYNPVADRLEVIWYTNASAGLRDRVIDANARYAIGVSPLNARFAADGGTIMDAAPFGLAGIPSVALTEGYGAGGAIYPGYGPLHTVNDTPDKVTNPRLWLKAARLTLAVALELARE